MDLTPFCNPASGRAHLTKPVRAGGYLYATQGHIVVRIADDPSIDAATDDAFGERLEALINTAHETARTWRPAPAVDSIRMKECRVCGGTGRIATCESCDGEGEFENHGHTYHCEECDGTGSTPADTANAGVTCMYCGGAGKYSYLGMEFDGVLIAAGLVARIAAIPGAEIGINPDEPNSIQAFRGDGAMGAVMPMRR